MIRVRFAPSPTGFLHVGGARTALFNWLFARKNKGKFILRIEDTDLKRSTTESRESILESMRWLGLDWDEGPDIGGPYGPYVQSERLEIYKRYAEKLEKEGLAYKCFCTDEELKAEREKQLNEGKAPRYSGKCRYLTQAQIEKNLTEGRPYVIRLKVDDRDIVINDLIKGTVRFQAGYVYDFILLKSDGTPTYNFGVVIDDALMQINYVIRGDDHLSNTPRQIMIYEALNFKKPLFAHIPMIHGPDNTRLSKRHGATAIEYFRDKGYLPEAMINFLALLGWAPKDGKEILTMDELIDRFDLRDVSRSAAIFNYEKLNWMNGLYIRNLEDAELLEHLRPFINKEYLAYGEKLELAVKAVKDHLTVLSDINEQLKLFFDDDISIEPDAAKFLKEQADIARIIANRFLALDREFVDENEYRNFMKGISKETGAKGKFLFMPLRILMTGKMHGPPLFSIIQVLGLERLKNRIARVMEGV